jgi:hypothetical protein
MDEIKIKAVAFLGGQPHALPEVGNAIPINLIKGWNSAPCTIVRINDEQYVYEVSIKSQPPKEGCAV